MQHVVLVRQLPYHFLESRRSKELPCNPKLCFFPFSEKAAEKHELIDDGAEIIRSSIFYAETYCAKHGHAYAGPPLASRIPT